MNKVVIGVDAGKKGAAAAYDVVAASLLDVCNIPLNYDRDLDPIEFYIWMAKYDPVLVVVEDCWQPLTLVRMCGEIAAVGKLLGAIVERVAVVTWKKDMLGHNSSDKKESIALCQKLIPTADLRATAKAKSPSPDRAEAVLLALYAAKILPSQETSSD